jgi:hypothetical protein
MQFSVPQFTDVEDRIVAGLSIKQFGIVFGAGVIIFGFFSLTKSIVVTVIIGLLVGLPALVVAFGKMNGRPIYSAFGNFMRYFTGGKIYIFHKQVQDIVDDSKNKVEIKQQAPSAPDAQTAVMRMKQLNYLLQQQAGEEQALLDRIASEKTQNHGR